MSACFKCILLALIARCWSDNASS